MGPKVFGWNQNIRIFEYRLRCGEGFLIFWAGLDWFLPVVIGCPIIEDVFLSTLHIPAMKWFLNVLIALSTLSALWLLGGTNCYLMFMVVIFSCKAVDASFSMKWKAGLIPQMFKYFVNDVKDLIIFLSLLLLISVGRILLHSCTYITYKYLFPMIEVLGKRPHRSE